MGRFAEVYTHEQKEAAAQAYVDKAVRPAAAVVQLAKEGRLTYNGREVPAFEMPEATVRDCARNLRKRRAGEIESEMVRLPPRDAIEALRRRLVSIADRELAALERDKAGTADLERLRQVTRCVREAAALPGPKDPRPKQPGDNQGGEREGGITRGGLAGPIIAAAGLGRGTTA